MVEYWTWGWGLLVWDSTDALYCNGVARKLKKLRTSKGVYWIKQWFSPIVSLFKMETSLKEKNLLPEGANSFLYEQFLIVWKITFNYIKWSPLNVTIFITHMGNLSNGCYSNELCPWARHFILCLVLVQPRKTRNTVKPQLFEVPGNAGTLSNNR